jgi:protoheme IX farnesyltransferase
MTTTRIVSLNFFSGERYRLFSDYFSLTKPRLSSLVIFTCALGMFLAPGEITFLTGLFSIIATSGLVGGACVINCYMERDIDALMERTKNRPLPSGRITATSALTLGLILISVCLLSLYFLVNPLTAFLGLVAAVVYIALYTPMKTKTSWALFAGAVPGAIPPLMGWTSVTNSVDTYGLILFGILFIWQLPHFLSISIYHSKDYNNAAIKTFPTEIGFKATRNRIVIYTIALFLISLGPDFIDATTENYRLSVCLLGGSFSLYALWGYFIDDKSETFLQWARTYFYSSLVYLPMVFIFMLWFR